MALKHIVHVVEATFAGVGRHALDLAEWQSSQGLKVTVFYSETRISNAFKSQLNSLENVEFIPFKSKNLPSIADIPIIYKVRKFCQQNKVSIVHGHSSKGGFIARLAGIGIGVGVIYTPNAFYSMNPTLTSVKRKVFGYSEKVLSIISDSVVCVSPEESDHAIDIGIPDHKLRIIPNGINPPESIPKENICAELNLDPTKPIIGFVGRFDIQKSPLDLVKVCSLVATKDSGAIFCLVGDGPLWDEAKALVQTLGIADRVYFPGVISGVRAMQAFDVFLLPSRYEGFPYVLIEAVMSGVPIITTRAACASSLMTMDCGYIHDVGDVQGMSESVLALIQNQSLLNQKSSNAKSVSNGFTLDRMCKSVHALYQTISN